MDLKGKKVLLMGLGILGGGVATAKFLIEKGASLTITDMKDELYLESSLLKLVEYKDKIIYHLGGHNEKDFLENDLIVINPDVSVENKFVKFAKENGKDVENELTLFNYFSPCKISIGITGTRGKTTTTNWINFILNSSGKKSLVLGNDPHKPLLSQIKECDEDTIAVIEQSSFALEIEPKISPNIAVITNIYRDHLNRHKTMEEYAKAKSNIFKNQKEDDFLILNKENEWTDFFVDLKPKSKILIPYLDILPNLDKDGFIKMYGEHNLSNFILASQACLLLGVSEAEILKIVKILPQVKWRQELVFQDKDLIIYNDTAATSPEGNIAAVNRFYKTEKFFILICGGTDRDLDYEKWGKDVGDKIKTEDLVLLSGSATEKMKQSLGRESFNEFDTLEECFDYALSRAKSLGGRSIIVFSPGAKSFEKFKNEFDRGEKFNVLVDHFKKAKGLL